MKTRAASFFVYQDNEEPSAHLPGTFAEERFVAIAGTPGRLRKVLSITTMRQSHYRADSGGDIKYVYRARLSFMRDASGRLSTIASYSHETLNGKLTGSWVEQYKWNPVRRGFDIVGR